MSGGSNDRSRPLRWPEMLAFGTGEIGFAFYWKTFELFLLFFYTDVFGISAAAAGTLLLVSRISDAVSDPLMGILADRTQTRWGKFRPFMLWMCVPLAGAGVLTFSTPDLDDSAKLIYAYATYVFMMLMYTAANIPYTALLGVMTGDVRKRTTLSTFMLVCAFSGGMLVAGVTGDLVDWLGGGDAARGWQLTMVLYGVAAVAALLTTFVGTRERVAPPVGQKTSIKRDIGDLLANRPWLILFALGFIVILTIALRNGAFIYYVKYYAEREDLRESFLIAGQAPMALGAALTPWLMRFFDKKQLFTYLMLLVAALSALLFLVPRDTVWAMFVLNILISAALGPKAVLSMAMFADCADFSEWQTGRRATGLIFSATTFSIKFGGAVAGWTSGMLLSVVGYVPNQAQSEGALNGIVWLSSVIPGGCALVAALVVRFYTLNGKKLAEIQSELESRRKKSKTFAQPT